MARPGQLGILKNIEEVNQCASEQPYRDTLRTKLLRTIESNGYRIREAEKEIEDAKKTIALLDRNKELETLLNLLGR